MAETSFAPPSLAMSALAGAFLTVRRRRARADRERGQAPVSILYLHRVSDRGLDHPEPIRRELAASKSALERMIGRAVPRFSIPSAAMPQCRPEVVEAAREAGYRRIYSAFGGRNLVDPAGRVGYVLQRTWFKFDSLRF